MINLKGKRILIFGATGGIGYSVVETCLSIEGEVIVSSRSEEKLKSIAKKRDNIQISVLDLCITSEYESFVNTLPQIDGVVFTNGKIEPFPTKHLKSKHISSMFDVNFSSIVELVSVLLKKGKLNNSASLVFLSSISAHHPYQGGAMYSASKAALTAYARTLALELAPKKIRANVVSPALVKTKMFDDTASAYTTDVFNQFLDRYPLGVGEPKDVAGMIAFLLSDLSRWMTGTEIIMDGGLTLSSK